MILAKFVMNHAIFLSSSAASWDPLEIVRVTVKLVDRRVLRRLPGILGNGRNVVDTDLSRQPTS